MASTWTAYGLLLLATVQLTNADGTGLIGLGKTMYSPTCAFACRNVIAACPLRCTPKEKGAKTPPECYTTDQAFMRTLALCINMYCSEYDHPSMGKIENYWESHLASGTVAKFEWKPAVTYGEALSLAKTDEKNGVGRNKTMSSGGEHMPRLVLRHGGSPGSEDEEVGMEPTNSSLPTIKSSTPLNATSLVVKKDFLKNYNGLKGFETNETGHTRYT